MRRLAVLPAVVLFGFGMGCPRNPRFHSLMPAMSTTPLPLEQAKPRWVLEPVEVPAGLNRMQWVVWEAGRRKVLEYDRWIEHPADEIRDALSYKLRDAPGAGGQIVLSVLRWDAEPCNAVVVEARWEVKPTNGTAYHCQVRVVEPAPHRKLADAHTKAFEQLGDNMITSLAGCKSGGAAAPLPPLIGLGRSICLRDGGTQPIDW
jgi:uncharacterized lipoprotein YmbA